MVNVLFRFMLHLGRLCVSVSVNQSWPHYAVVGCCCGIDNRLSIQFHSLLSCVRYSICSQNFQFCLVANEEHTQKVYILMAKTVFNSITDHLNKKHKCNEKWAGTIFVIDFNAINVEAIPFFFCFVRKLHISFSSSKEKLLVSINDR